MEDAERLQLIEELVKNVTAVATDEFADAQKAREDFLEYDRLRNINSQEITGEDEQKKSELRKKVITMMSLDQETALKLGYESEMSELLAQQEALQTDAERTGMDKICNDFTGRKKSAANKKIEQTKKRRKAIADMRRKEKVEATFENEERYYPIKEDFDEQMESGKNSGAMLQRLGNTLLIGSRENRRREFEKPSYDNTVTEEVSCITDDGVLKGVLHRTMVKPTGKLVIFFSGNTASTMSQSKDVAKVHLENGANVLCMDYRGFGESITTDRQQNKENTHLVEDGMYRDSMAMFNYAKDNNLVKNNSDIILHGYSLGGSMASRVAAQVAYNNANTANDREVSEKERLGGLILQSPINSAENAARLTLSTPEKFRENKTNCLVNSLGKVLKNASGKFSTEEHMQTVKKYDPHIPVLFLSGSSKVKGADGNEEAGDFISLEDTKVDQLTDMKNSATFIGEHKHVPSKMQFKDIRDQTTQSDGKLEALLKFGRATDLRMDKQTEAKKIKGLEESDGIAYKQPRSVILKYIRDHTDEHENALTEASARKKFMDVCQENPELIVKTTFESLVVPENIEVSQLKNLLTNHKPYAVCASTMTHIGSQMLEKNPPQMDDEELMANLSKPMEKGVEQNGDSNVKNVLDCLGKMEQRSFNYFMQNEQIAEIYKQAQATLSTNKMIAESPEMMGQALAVLFTDLGLKYMSYFNKGNLKKQNAFGMLARNSSMIVSKGDKVNAAKRFADYVPAKAFDTVVNSITSGTASLIAENLKKQ